MSSGKFGLTAAALVVLEEQAGRFVPVTELATWLAMLTLRQVIAVQDLLETMWAGGLVQVLRDANGYISAAAAPPPECKDLPEQPAALPPQPLSAPRPYSAAEATKPLPHAPQALEPFGTGFRPAPAPFDPATTTPIPA